MSFKRTCALIAISNESALIHFALGNFFTWKSHAGLKLHFGENDRYEIHTGLHLISPQFMRTQLKKWLSTEVRFSTEIKSYTSLSSFRLSCEGTLILKWKICYKDSVVSPSYLNLLGKIVSEYIVKVSDKTIINNKCEKLIGIKIDKELNFNEHVQPLCKKANPKVNALSRVASVVNFEQRWLIMNSFITSYFSNCPVVWVFHSRKLNDRTDKLQERILRIVLRP